MMKDQYALGVDSSTSATKVIAFDAHGKTVSEGAHNYPLYAEYPGWVEQDAEDWWGSAQKGLSAGRCPSIDLEKPDCRHWLHPSAFYFCPD